MEKFSIPKKEKCPSNGYTTKYNKSTIDEFCDNPDKYKSVSYIGVINDAITIYKYSDYISREWIEYVIRKLSPYIK